MGRHKRSTIVLVVAFALGMIVQGGLSAVVSWAKVDGQDYRQLIDNLDFVRAVQGVVEDCQLVENGSEERNVVIEC